MSGKLLRFGGILLVFLVLAGLIAVVAYQQAQQFFVTYNVTQLQGLALVENTPVPEPGSTPAIDDGAYVPEAGPSGPIPDPWDGASPVAILVMGIDAGSSNTTDREGPPKTDSMILIKIDPLAKTIGILNIPRDLWVNIPGFDYYKINMAYFLGESAQLPDGGPGLAMKTVEGLLGVPINYYAQIDFVAFEKFVDQIGGIELDVAEEITVDPIGKGNTVILQPGKQVVAGPVALAYARARKTEGGDFDRALRQQQVILAIRKQVLDPIRFPGLVANSSQIYNDLASGIHTNLTFNQAMQLGWLVTSIPEESIRRGVIAPPDAVLLAKSPDGTQDILKPITDKIRELRDEVFGGSQAFLPTSAAGYSPAELVKAEGAKVVVSNAAGVEGLAAKTQEYLTTLEVNVVSSGNASQFPPTTRVVDYTGNPYTLKFLVDLMRISPNQIIYQYNPVSDVDVEVIIGPDWANNNPMP